MFVKKRDLFAQLEQMKEIPEPLGCAIGWVCPMGLWGSGRCLGVMLDAECRDEGSALNHPSVCCIQVHVASVISQKGDPRVKDAQCPNPVLRGGSQQKLRFVSLMASA